MTSRFRHPSQSGPETAARGDNDGPSSALQGEASAELTAELTPGCMVGDKYLVTGLLGVGASGAVYEAQHREIGHRVAIKVVHRALATRDDIIARFRLEAKVCGSMRDKHVGQVYDVGQLEDGSPYMVMELQEGTSLESLLQQERLPIATAVDAARQLLSGLNAAHQLGVVHRDVKPGNLMISRESTGEVVLKVVDFGISKAIAPDISERSVTRENTVLGSPDYMSPEQLRGSDVDQRSDIYAVGVVLYQAVTGHLPFDAPSLTELLASVLRDPVSPPSELRADCPVELEQIILRAMSRDRARRFGSAVEMSDALASAAAAHSLARGLEAWKEVEHLLSAPAAALAGGVTPSGSEAQGEAVHQPASGAQGPAADASAAKNGYAVETAGVRTLAFRLPRPRRWPLWVGGAVGISALALFLAVQDQTSNRRRLQELPSPSASATVSHPDIDPRPPQQLGAQGIEAQSALSSQARVAAPLADASGTEPPKTATAAPVGLAQGDARTRRGRPAAPSGSLRKNRDRRAAKKALRSATPPSAPQGVQPAESVDDLLTQAAAAYVRGQIPVARALYRKVVQRAPRNAAGWRGLGMASSRMGQPKEAIRAFKRYLSLAPSAADAASIRRKLKQLEP